MAVFFAMRHDLVEEEGDRESLPVPRTKHFIGAMDVDLSLTPPPKQSRVQESSPAEQHSWTRCRALGPQVSDPVVSGSLWSHRMAAEQPQRQSVDELKDVNAMKAEPGMLPPPAGVNVPSGDAPCGDQDQIIIIGSHTKAEQAAIALAQAKVLAKQSKQVAKTKMRKVKEEKPKCPGVQVPPSESASGSESAATAATASTDIAVQVGYSWHLCWPPAAQGRGEVGGLQRAPFRLRVMSSHMAG